jgi:Tat protein translocase TatB subunit
MFGIGLPEMLIIGLVALVVLGPDRLPEAARNFGKAIADIRRATEPARTAWTEMTTEITNVVSTTGNPWTVHPILEKMTLEERESYMKGGAMPERIAQELERIEREPPPVSEGLAALELDYPMPHEVQNASAIGRPQVEPEPLSYPSPDGKTSLQRGE